MSRRPLSVFFIIRTSTTEIYTLSLHDALPISLPRRGHRGPLVGTGQAPARDPGARDPPRRRHARHQGRRAAEDRKSTRLNSSHVAISYAVFCLKKKKKKKYPERTRSQTRGSSR